MSNMNPRIFLGHDAFGTTSQNAAKKLPQTSSTDAHPGTDNGRPTGGVSWQYIEYVRGKVRESLFQCWGRKASRCAGLVSFNAKRVRRGRLESAEPACQATDSHERSMFKANREGCVVIVMRTT